MKGLLIEHIDSSTFKPHLHFYSIEKLSIPVHESAVVSARSELEDLIECYTLLVVGHYEEPEVSESLFMAPWQNPKLPEGSADSASAEGGHHPGAYFAAVL